MIEKKKQAQREQAFQHRKTLSNETAAFQAANNFLKNIQQSQESKISLYRPIGSELNTQPLFEKLWAQSVSCLLPVIKAAGEPLFFRLWNKGEPLVKGPFDVPVPDTGAPVFTPDILLVPLLAFDPQGYRMGYGGGYYDRTLEQLRRQGPCVAVGFAYAGQEIEEVVIDAHDQKLDWIITETDARKIV